MHSGYKKRNRHERFLFVFNEDINYRGIQYWTNRHMTLFESSIRTLNIPEYVMDDIVSIRNICMEAEQPQQPAQSQAANHAQPQQAHQQKPAQAQPQQPANQQQNAAQAQPQQNANPQAGTQQGQPQAQGNAQQQQPQQNAQEVPQNIEETQVDANQLMKAFNNYLSGCQQKLTKMLTSKFGQDAKTAIDNVKSYVESNSQIDFNKEVAPFLSVNGKPISDPKVIDGIRKNLEKYFGAKFVSSTPEEKKQEQPNPQAQPQEQAQPAK